MDKTILTGEEELERESKDRRPVCPSAPERLAADVNSIKLTVNEASGTLIADQELKE